MLCHVAHGFLCYFLHVLLAWWLTYFSTPLTLSLLLPSFSLPQVALPNQSLLAMQLANQFFFLLTMSIIHGRIFFQESWYLEISSLA